MIDINIKGTEYLNWLFQEKVEFEELGYRIVDEISDGSKFTFDPTQIIKDSKYFPSRFVENKDETLKGLKECCGLGVYDEDYDEFCNDNEVLNVNVMWGWNEKD